MSTVEEPHLTFRKTVEKITKEIGGNLEAFVIGFTVKRKHLPDPPTDPEKGEEKMWFTFSGGEREDQVSIILENVTGIAEMYIQQARYDRYTGVEILKAAILQTLLKREKTRKP